ncbi:MAG TPA: enoyl-CoA hydratase/isomerase family protein [Bryobacteraceae bacterium]|nr:enoyl-CoA hydratase/isomerase family protein [Bryobacteraceae bacterium]
MYSETSNCTTPVEVSREQEIAIVTLNRTNRRNALTSEARIELTAQINSAAEDKDTRAIVLASRDSSFSAGQDLSEAKDFSADVIPVWIQEHMDLYRAVLRYPAPIVAAVDGCCVGAGLQTALLCDLRIGSSNAYFTMPELDDAIPCILGVWTLWDIVGRSRTYEMVLTNRSVPAEEALQWGILNQIVPSSQLLRRACEIARYLSCKPQLAFRLTKERLADLTLRECESLAVHASYSHMQAFASGEPKLAMEAFLDHRRAPIPQWLSPFSNGSQNSNGNNGNGNH